MVKCQIIIRDEMRNNRRQRDDVYFLSVRGTAWHSTDSAISPAGWLIRWPGPPSPHIWTKWSESRSEFPLSPAGSSAHEVPGCTQECRIQWPIDQKDSVKVYSPNRAPKREAKPNRTLPTSPKYAQPIRLENTCQVHGTWQIPTKRVLHQTIYR